MIPAIVFLMAFVTFVGFCHTIKEVINHFKNK